MITDSIGYRPGVVFAVEGDIHCDRIGLVATAVDAGCPAGIESVGVGGAAVPPSQDAGVVQ
ncbi:hypothetical protein ACXIZN_41415 [Amycolatopsis sp. TRM77291]